MSLEQFWSFVEPIILALLALQIRRWLLTLGPTLGQHVASAIQEPLANVQTQGSDVAKALDVFNKAQSYLIDANTSLRHRLEDMSVRYDNLTAQFNADHARLNTYSDNLGDITAALEKSEKERTQLSEKVNALEQTLKGTNTTLVNTQAELDLTRRELETTRVELESAKKRIGDLESQRDAERRTAASEKQALETELQSEREKVASLQTQVNDLQKQVTDLQAQLDAQKVAALPSADPDPTTPMPGGMPNGLSVIVPESKP